MAAPIVKGIIIATSVIVGTAIVLYESPELRVWLDERRRRIAIAMYSVGDSINPTPSSRASDAESEATADASRRRRQEIVRRNRNALIKKAQEEGIAVDLDELASVGKEKEDPPVHSASSFKSFDDMLEDDGKLKTDVPEMAEASSTGTIWGSQPGLRNRSAGTRGFESGASFANPFDDEAQVLFDQELIAPSAEELPVQDQSSPATISAEPKKKTHRGCRGGQRKQAAIRNSMSEDQPQQTLIDIPVTEESSALPQDSPTPQYKTDEELEAEIEEAIRRSLQDTPSPELLFLNDSFAPLSPPETNPFRANQQLPGSFPTFEDHHPMGQPLDDSLYAPPTPRRLPSPDPAVTDTEPMELDDRSVTAGAQSPSEAAFSATSSAGSDAEVLTAASQIGSEAEDIANLAEVESIHDADARSEADMSEFSVVGPSTPGSWTDVESDSEMEEAGNGRGHR